MGYNIQCIGNVDNNGGSNLTSVGFYYTGSTTPETYGSESASLPTTLPSQFTTTLTSLSAGTDYMIKSYATNSVGTTLSAPMIIKTLGVINPAVISFSAVFRNFENFCEFGSQSIVTTSCDITPNDEVFLNFFQIQTYNMIIPNPAWLQILLNDPPAALPLSINPITQTYTLNVPIPINSSQESMDITSIATLKFGNPTYTLTKSVTNYAVYPILYVVDTTNSHSASYYDENTHGEGYKGNLFYNDALASYTNGTGGYSLINTSQQIIVYNRLGSSAYVHIGYPVGYGELSIEGVDMSGVIPQTMSVRGEPYGNWYHNYYIYNLSWIYLGGGSSSTLTLSISFKIL